VGEEKKSSFANAAYTAAEKALKEAHKDEFEALLQAEYDKAGVKRVKRLTAEERAAKVAEEKAAKEAAKKAAEREKAQATLDALLATYPDLQPTSALADLADEVA
jgi:transketolase